MPDDPTADAKRRYDEAVFELGMTSVDDVYLPDSSDATPEQVTEALDTAESELDSREDEISSARAALGAARAAAEEWVDAATGTEAA